MTRTLITLLLAMCTLPALSQAFIDVKAGLTSRFMPTGYADAGFRWGSIQLSSTIGAEGGMGFNAGVIAGWQPAYVKLYAGYAWFAATNGKLAEGSRPYPVAGIQWRDRWSRGLVDLRYMGDAFHITFGFTFGKED